MIYPPPTSPHDFHIPVMGTGFSIDTPLKVAKYGISSVISIMDDKLLEQLREVHSLKNGLEYVEIEDNAEDMRARRITAYLNMLNELVALQLSHVRSSPFESGSEITRYFELLPDSPLRDSYYEMLGMSANDEKLALQTKLRTQVTPGSIDVNILTKVDKDAYDKDKNKLPPEFSDAMAALRGYGRSSLQSSIVLSAGLNIRLYGYLTSFEDFFPNSDGELRKKITLKVSDYRSAFIQGKYLAKRGLWVSEYRVESGLNCGGHAFATEGHLLGPIMDEFVEKRSQLKDELHKTYNTALESANRAPMTVAPELRVTVQGGIGNHEEQQLMFERYGVDGVGWGTPFLLVPEVTNVDDEHLAKLCAATEEDVNLSNHSPLGVPFWSLETSASEDVRLARIAKKRPGSPCPKGHLESNTEFTDSPICPASRNYQRRKLRQLDANDHNCSETALAREKVLRKSCLCLDLAGGVTGKYGIDDDPKMSVCCGPNIVNFSKVATLDEMVSHIYGRLSLMDAADRPHMLIKELSLYVDYFREEFQIAAEEFTDRTAKRYLEFKRNLNYGIDHYRELAERFSEQQKERFHSALDSLYEEIDNIHAELEGSMNQPLHARLA